MERTTVLADETTIAKLKALAADRGLAFSQIVREALDEKAAEYRPRPRSLGVGRSRGGAASSSRATKRQPPRSWR